LVGLSGDTAPAAVEPIRHPTAVRIMNSAVELFYERGFVGTSVRDITRACNLTPGSLYVHFPSKDALLSAIIRQGMAIMDERAAQTIANRDTDDYEATLVDLVDIYVWYVTEHQHLARVADHFWRQLAPAERHTALEVRQRITQGFVDAIQRGVAAGRFAPLRSDEIGLIAVGLPSMMNGILDWYSPEGRFPQAALSRRFQAMALRLVGNRPAATSKPRRPRSR
jgi:AcrR family transcriptional regulator